MMPTVRLGIEPNTFQLGDSASHYSIFIPTLSACGYDPDSVTLALTDLVLQGFEVVCINKITTVDGYISVKKRNCWIANINIWEMSYKRDSWPVMYSHNPIREFSVVVFAPIARLSHWKIFFYLFCRYQKNATYCDTLLSLV